MMRLADLLAVRVEGWTRRWDERETMLYALSLGFGGGGDPGDLRYVYEGAGLVALPTMAMVLSSTGALARMGVPMPQLLHAGQRLRIHAPLPAAGALVADAHVAAVVDRGPGKGAMIELRTEARCAESRAPLFTSEMVVLARTLGGIDRGEAAVSPDGPAPQPIDRAPDTCVTLDTRNDAALLYRLNGDRNPLHADPAIARSAGFAGPILHGLCTYGMATRALAGAGIGPDEIAALDARFSQPVFPGDRLTFDIWHEPGAARFRCRVAEREAVVLRDGLCRLA